MMKPAPPREEREWLTSTEVCDELDVTYRRLNWWTMRGWIVPSVHKAGGTGDRHRWSEADLGRAREIRDKLDAVHELTEAGAEI